MLGAGYRHGLAGPSSSGTHDVIGHDNRAASNGLKIGRRKRVLRTTRPCADRRTDALRGRDRTRCPGGIFRGLPQAS